MLKTELPQHGNAKYPWQLWENGEVFIVKMGRHFQIPVESFRRSLSIRAAKIGQKVTTRVKGNTVTFQFTPKSGKKS